MSIDEFISGFGEQEEHEEKKIDVIRNPRVEEICRTFEYFLKEEHVKRENGIFGRESVFNQMNSDSIVINSVKKLAPLKLTSQEIRKFSLCWIDYNLRKQGFYRTGLFLDCLIRLSEDSSFEIFTEHLKKEDQDMINSLGYKNHKNIIIRGDVGACLGLEIQEGCINVFGNTGDHTGQNMHGGIILIEGNTEYNLGCQMYNGSIIVKGNTGDDVGKDMIGGKIEVYGDIGSISKGFKGGEIYHKGVRIR